MEALGIQSIPFVVTTRVIAGMITIVPLYAGRHGVELCVVRAGRQRAARQLFGYVTTMIDLFIHPSDVVFSLLKAVIFVTLIIAIDCYQGYNAGGGPEGVGRASVSSHNRGYTPTRVSPPTWR